MTQSERLSPSRAANYAYKGTADREGDGLTDAGDAQ
jgi:hypothetical protein